jgi:hypothetical protein
MTEAQTPIVTASRWSKHITQRSKWGWAVAIIYGLIGVLGVFAPLINYFSPPTDLPATPPDALSSVLITMGVTFLMFYGVYWFFMWLAYYAPKWVGDLMSLAAEIISIFK